MPLFFCEIVSADRPPFQWLDAARIRVISVYSCTIDLGHYNATTPRV